MTHTLKRMPSRKIQLLGIAILAVATHLMTPGEATWPQLAGIGIAYVGLLVYGLDNYREGLEDGMRIMDRIRS